MSEFTIPVIFQGLELNEAQQNELKSMIAREKGANNSMIEAQKQVKSLESKSKELETLIKGYQDKENDNLSESEKLSQQIDELKKQFTQSEQDKRIATLQRDNLEKAQALMAEKKIPMAFLKPYMNAENFLEEVEEVVKCYEEDKARLIADNLPSTPKTQPTQEIEPRKITGINNE